MLVDFEDDRECVVAWRIHPLGRQSLFRGMVDNYSSLTTLPALPSENRHLQHQVEYLASLTPDPCGESLRRRAQRFSGAVPLTDDEDILVSTIFCRIVPHLPLSSLSSFLRVPFG